MKKFYLLFLVLITTLVVNAQNPFIREVTYRGAFAPAPATPWTDGWTNWTPQTTDYGTPTVTVNAAITANTTWTSNNVYLIQGLIYVKNGATLTIQPGTKILGDATIANSSLVITKGSRINAVGTSTNPIVFSSSKVAGQRAPGDWGGIVILGKGTLNRPGGTANIEGIAASADTEYGGGATPDNEDNSGNLKYVRIEYGGYVFATDQEINGLTLGAVGRNTTIDYVQTSYINDDAFEWFGGTVNAAHLVAYKCLDDDFDTDFGYSGSVQFALSVRDPLISDQSAGSTSEGFESDNDATGSTNTPQTSCVFSNVTVIGPYKGSVGIAAPTGTFKFRRAARLRRNSGIKILNSILNDFPYGVFIDGIAVRNNLQTGRTVFKDNILAGNFRATEPGTATALVDSLFNQFGNDSLTSTSGILVSPYDSTNYDFRPAISSPALSGVNFSDAAFNNRKIIVSSSSSIREVTYRGAFAPSPAAMWTEGWTNWDPNNTSYPSPTVTVTGTISSNTTWTASNTYLISGLVYVASGVTLTIEPGTVILGDAANPNSSLIITRNAKIIAAGTVSNPIVFTSSKAAGSRALGDWGGLIILGNASLNRPGGVANIEGIAASTSTEYGGGANPNDDDNSGTLKFVRVEFGGYVFATDQEINGITFGAVGRGTVVDYVQASYINDDAFEWFGGTVNCSHLVAYRSLDDNWDTDFGFSGSVQFALGVRDPNISDQSAGSTSEGFESDNDGTGSTNTPQTRALFSNVTEIGPFRGTILSSNAATFKFRRAARIRRNSGLRLFNSILTDYPAGLFIDGIAVRNNLQTGVTKFKNNLVAGNYLAMEAGTVAAVRDSLFSNANGFFKNDSLSTTSNVFVNPYDYLSPDYRPGSEPLATTGASFTDEVFTGLVAPCDEVTSPGVISGPTNIHTCDTATAHTYSVVLKSDASTYLWTVPTGARIISGQGTRTIVVKFASTYVSGRTISVVASNVCGNTSAASTKIIYKVAPSLPSAITGDRNSCASIGGTATYTSTTVLNADSYTWQVPATGASIVSGQGTNSIVVAFTSSYVGGNIGVKANGACFTTGTAFRTLAVTKTPPALPAAITGLTDVCPQFSSPSSDSSSVVTYTIRRVLNAASYTWTAPSGARIVSGQGDTSVTVKFVNTFVSGSLSVISVSPCGNSAARSLTIYRRVAIQPGAIQKSFSPSVPAVIAVSGQASETYMIRKVAYATSYSWALKSGLNASISSINGAGANDTAVTVTFSNGFTNDSLIVIAQTACSKSISRKIFLSALSVPAGISTITSSTGDFAPCPSATGIVYTATGLVPTISQSPINRFRWTVPTGGQITAANSDSSEVTVNYLNTYKGGSLVVRSVSPDGVLGSAKSQVLKYLPPTPTSISSRTGNSVPLRGDTITYTVVMPVTSVTQATPTGYSWTLPRNTSILEANTDSSAVKVSFSNTYTGGSISVKAKSVCGVVGGARSLALTLGVVGVAPNGVNNGTSISIQENNEQNSGQIYPNPSNGSFTLRVKTDIFENINVQVKIHDLGGKQVAHFNTENNSGYINAKYDASHLDNGLYTVSYILNGQLKSLRLIVQK